MAGRLYLDTSAILRAVLESGIAPDLQERVYEVHPELCFWSLNGDSPLAYAKKRLAGRLERWSMLRCVLPGLPQRPPMPREMPQTCGVDDYIDGIVAAWTALCIARGAARRVPLIPDADERGLRMEIWFPRS